MSRGAVLRAAGPLLCVALGYYVSGRLGLLLALPPGYATAVWPASGIALAGVLYFGSRAGWGIWLGSFLINVWTALDLRSLTEALLSVLPAALIALGAAVQALAGAALIRRWIGYKNLLTQEMGAVHILLLGGPVACVISASIGVGTLWARDLVPTESFWVNWFTWWIGDSVGVMIFTPLVLVWTVRPITEWLSRQIYATVPLVLGFVLVVALFVSVSHREQARLHADFRGAAAEFRLQLQRDLKDYMDVLHSMQGFHESADTVDRDDFNRFAGRLLAQVPSIRALSWNPRIRTRGQVDDVTVQYIVPVEGNERALGYNVASDAQRADALRRAVERAAPAATAPLRLVQQSARADGILIFIPVYPPELPQASREDRVRNLRGFVAAVSLVEDMLSAALRQIEGRGIQVRVMDRSGPEPLALWALPNASDRSPTDLLESFRLDVGGRVWEVELRVPGAYLVANRSWQTWTLLAAGMLFTGLFGMFLLVVIGRSAVIEQQVTERTAELRQANSMLYRETVRSEQLEAEARRQNQELEASNQELEQFASIASHDLQAPLRNLSAFTGLIEHRLGDKLDPEDRQHFEAIRSGSAHMRGLIEGLLRMSRLGRERLQRVPVSVKQCLDRALTALQEDLRTTDARVESGDLPTVLADATLLSQLFQNLLGNALKFQPKGQRPVIAVSGELHQNEWLFSVRDNGIGVAPEQLNQMFGMFKRLHREEEYAGDGIGLALCRKIVRLHQGRIWAESRPGAGTTIYFTLPASPETA